jgi:peroxiredoxin
VLDKVAEKFSGDRLAVLTINSDRSRRTIAKTLDKVDTSLPVLRDIESEVFDAYRAHAIPTLYLIDQQGKIYTAWSGYVDDLEVELTDNIEFILENHETSPGAESVDLASFREG